MDNMFESKQETISEEDIENIIGMLDQKTTSGVSRIKVEVSDAQQAGTMHEKYHHGRCDVGSVFANGMKNVDCG